MRMLVIPKKRACRWVGSKLPVVGTFGAYDEVCMTQMTDAEVGCCSACRYCVTLDNPANKKFVQS